MTKASAREDWRLVLRGTSSSSNRRHDRSGRDESSREFTRAAERTSASCAGRQIFAIRGRTANPAWHQREYLLRWERERRGTPLAPTPARGSFSHGRLQWSPRPRANADEHTATWIGTLDNPAAVWWAMLNIITDPVLQRSGPFPVAVAGARVALMPPGMAIDALTAARHRAALAQSTYDPSRQACREAIGASTSLVDMDRSVGARFRMFRGWGCEKEIVRNRTGGQEAPNGQRTPRYGNSPARPLQRAAESATENKSSVVWIRVAVAIGDRRGYFAGDTGVITPRSCRSASDCGPFDFVMMPIGARNDPRWYLSTSLQVDPEEAVQALPRSAACVHAEAPLPLMLGSSLGDRSVSQMRLDGRASHADARAMAREQGLERSRGGGLASFGETRPLVDARVALRSYPF
jgi:hypothetical protein